MPLPSVTVVIPTYQRRGALPAVVEPLLRDAALHELVVSVDGSTDGTLEWLADRRRTDARLVPVMRPNGGIAAARQTGAEAATGEVLLFLDDDVIPGHGLLYGHARSHAERDDLVVQGYMPNEWAHLPAGRRGIARIYRRAYDATCARYEREPQHVLLGFWGGNFSLRRSQALRVGLASAAASHIRYQDDREFGIRCHRAGLRGAFDRTLRGNHRYERDLASFRRDGRHHGRDRCAIHALHPDVVGAELVDTTETANVVDLPGQGLPRPLRRLWPRLAADPLFGPLSALLAAAFHAGVALRSLSLETLAARALGSLEVQRGVLEFEESR
jgi:glycosyltransferase involved in cell wall biosynthesis